ncbi:DUF302 domain-containing protein [Prescottella equi]|uniref:DUF302 domain-containing protein n=1 Tax=Rhodococcus hoagii TaxID=43767 RepID=UPI0008538BF3|nr:DUF302 domain-containing protein [Prescottella equi]GBF12787.1 hypothetical protein Br6_00129 [Rhodococcus sp. Br-6]MDP8013588.1 DUF302 domain-containing protein [Prescottella equi]OQQ22047.1 ABC transporter [Prescottella equi]OQQ33166.1 ABC transporter [Prescottella equi]ORM00871.1 ABC transporter [Prescottella equi]
MELGISTRLNTEFDDAIAKTRAALQEQGFGVLTEIDMQATLKAKIGAEMERYVILGACNPQLAHRAVGVDRQIGLLLPCNVVVRSDGDGVIVEAMNPALMVAVTEEPGLEEVAAEATTRLEAAIDALT